MNQPESLSRLYVVATGMVTPVGGNTAMTLAAVNARINQYQASSYINRHSKPMTVARVPSEILPSLDDQGQLAKLNGREKRLIQLAKPALEEVLANYPLANPLPMFLAGPELLPSGAKSITAQILGHIVGQTGANINLQNSRYFSSGRTGVIEAIELAFRYLATTGNQYVLVGGVDSYLDAATLGFLDIEGRVLAEGMSDSFAPGEGAGFLLLSSKAPSSVAARLFRPGLGVEKGYIYSDEPYVGQGLTDAFTRAIANGCGEKIATVFSSMNGENYFVKEFGVAAMRNSQAFEQDYAHEHPADCYGDLGAASAVMLIAMAQAKILDSKSSAQSLVYCSADLASRAAVCLS